MHDFDTLTPDLILTATEAQGFKPTGALYPLNSYENRVYELPLENQTSIIAKFYRPHRWDFDTINEEHEFLNALVQADVTVVEPLRIQCADNRLGTLKSSNGFHHCFFPKFRGRERDDLSLEDRQWLGRTLARLHNVGAQFQAQHRMELTPETYGTQSLNQLLNHPVVPVDLLDHLEHVITHCIEICWDMFERKDWEFIAVHGDCHLGNILWNQQGLHLVDFDDMVVAPPAQDVWMLFHGSDDESKRQREALFEGYEMFRSFDYDSLVLAEPLRTLRMIRHNAWLAHRYDEEIFRKSFPYFTERRHWETFLLNLKEQLALLQEL